MWSPAFLESNMNEYKEQRPLEQEPQQTSVRPDPNDLYPVERFYERFRDVPLHRLDLFIGLCVAALVLVVLVGVLDGQGFF